jgi:hypothetical protein
MFFRINCRIINISRSILVIKESKANKQQNDFNYWNSFPTANRYNNYQSKFKLKICTYIFKRPLNLKLKSMSCKSLLTLRWIRRYLDVAAQIHTEHLWFFVTANCTCVRSILKKYRYKVYFVQQLYIYFHFSYHSMSNWINSISNGSLEGRKG